MDAVNPRSRVAKRSIVIKGHKTSVSLEAPFWNKLKAIAKGRNVSVAELVEGIDLERNFANLSSALRLFVLQDMEDRLAAETGPAGVSDELQHAAA